MSGLLRGAVRGLARLLLSEPTRRVLRARLTARRNGWPPLAVNAFDERRVVVLAPHMDDEVIGCGGTLLRHRAAGAELSVIYLTDGRRGDPRLGAGGLARNELEAALDALVRERKHEAERAAEVLGVQNLEFMDCPDGRLGADAATVGELATLLGKLGPDLIYLPAMSDPHPDHRATGAVLYRSLARLGRRGPRLRQYEVWSPLYPNRLVDVSAVMDTKLVAVAQFRSQLEHVDYARAVRGLNAYRSITQGGGTGYAEAFFETPPGPYRFLLDEVGEGQ